jgi:hypothetical protein
MGSVAELDFEFSGRTVREDGRSELRDPKMLVLVEEVMVGSLGIRMAFAKDTPCEVASPR